MQRTASRALRYAVWVGAALLGWAGPVHSQTLDEAEQIEAVADAATEVSSITDQIEATAYSPSGNQQAVLSVRALAGQATMVLDRIADESNQGSELSETRPLFDKAINASYQAMRVVQFGGVTVDPVLIEELTAGLNHLGGNYGVSRAAAEGEAP